MEYKVGQRLQWVPKLTHQQREVVEVVELRSRGQAKLSNGWVVDEGGYAEGTNRQPGGVVVEMPCQKS
jgi:hypothetical protein